MSIFIIIIIISTYNNNYKTLGFNKITNKDRKS